MPRYIVERTFHDGFRISLDEQGAEVCAAVVATNAKSTVTWAHSYVEQRGSSQDVLRLRWSDAGCDP